eukprot:438420_1
MGYCVNSDDLTPFIVVIIGAYVQCWINIFIFSVASAQSNNDDDNAEKCCKCCRCKCECDKIKSCVAPMIAVTKNLLVIFQIMKIIYVFVLDMIHFNNHLNDFHVSKWQNYNCFVEILMNSSNLKTCGVVSLITMLESYLFKIQRVLNSNPDKQAEVEVVIKDAIALQEPGFIIPNTMVDDLENPVIRHKNIVYQEQSNEEIELLVKYIVHIKQTRGVLPAVYAALTILIFVIMIGISFINVMAGLVCYGLLYFVIICALGMVLILCIASPMLCCIKALCGSTYSGKCLFCPWLVIGWFPSNEMNKYAGGVVFMKWPYGTVTMVLGLLIATLSQTYWYIEDDSWYHALEHVLTERRSLEVYISNINDELQTIVALVTNIF